MALTIPAPPAVGTSAGKAVDIPPGVCTVVLSNTGGANAVYIGLSNTVAISGAGQGFPLPAGATVTFTANPGSKGASLWAISSAATQSLGVIISNAQ